jgi:O-succinylbenzoate synthase
MIHDDTLRITRKRVPREAYLVIRARLARKAGLVGSFIFASRACHGRVACLAHRSQTTLHVQEQRIRACSRSFMNIAG